MAIPQSTQHQAVHPGADSLEEAASLARIDRLHKRLRTSTDASQTILDDLARRRDELNTLAWSTSCLQQRLSALRRREQAKVEVDAVDGDVAALEVRCRREEAHYSARLAAFERELRRAERSLARLRREQSGLKRQLRRRAAGRK